jgi:hypothetical protein
MSIRRPSIVATADQGTASERRAGHGGQAQQAAEQDGVVSPSE